MSRPHGGAALRRRRPMRENEQRAARVGYAGVPSYATWSASLRLLRRSMAAAMRDLRASGAPRSAIRHDAAQAAVRSVRVAGTTEYPSLWRWFGRAEPVAPGARASRIRRLRESIDNLAERAGSPATWCGESDELEARIEWGCLLVDFLQNYNVTR